MTLYCAKCGQRVLLRFGVHLSPTRADVFDAIQRQSKYGGIRVDVLAGMFAKTPACMKVHINHINKLLASKNWEIICEREGSAKGFYRVRRIHAQKIHLRGLPVLRGAIPSDHPGGGPSNRDCDSLGGNGLEVR